MDLVATWTVPLCDKIHKVQFEHGTVSGKRVVYVDGKVVLRKDFMFKLVGLESFKIGKARCTIQIDPVDGFYYGYTLKVNGKILEKFIESQAKDLIVWHWKTGDLHVRTALEKDTLDIWVNGKNVQTTRKFVDGGTETHFTLVNRKDPQTNTGKVDLLNACIKAVSSGKRKQGIVYSLFVNGTEIAPSKD